MSIQLKDVEKVEISYRFSMINLNVLMLVHNDLNLPGHY